MAVTTAYGFGFVESLDEGIIDSTVDAVGLANGGVAIVGGHAGHSDVRIFDANGDLTGSSDLHFGTQLAITQLSNGNLVIVGDTGTDMSFSILDGTTAALLPGPTSLGESGPDVLLPAVTALTGGGFVVAIQDYFGGTDNDIDLRVYNSAGTLITNFAADSSGADDQSPSVAALNDGGFAVAWHRNVTSSSFLWYAVYNADGSVRKAPEQFDAGGSINRNASAVGLDNGGFAIAYEDDGDPFGDDIEITLARFTAAGDFVDRDYVTRNDDATDDTASYLTQLSNGMLALGSIGPGFGLDPRWTLIDQNTGAPLGQASVGATIGDDTAPVVAAMTLGRMATFHSSGGDVQGQILQAQRFSTGDGANDLIVGDELQDIANGGAGFDILLGSLNADQLNGGADNDDFQFRDGEPDGDAIDGGTGSDSITVVETVSFLNASLISIERIQFFPVLGTTPQLTLRADQIGAGLAANLAVDSAQDQSDAIYIVMGTDTAVDLSQFTFTEWNAAEPEYDSITIVGDGDNETIVGSSVRDYVGAGYGNDTLIGGGGDDALGGDEGDDLLRGGIGDDTLDGGSADGGQSESDTADYSDATGGVTVSLAIAGPQAVGGGLGSDTLSRLENLTGGAFGDTLTGDGDDNILRGGGGNDTLIGGGGNDTFDGGSGSDTMSGGSGDNIYVVSTAGDTIAEAAGGGTDTVQTGMTYTLGTNLERLKLTSGSAINGTGNSGGNFIDGNTAANTLTGLNGADRLDGKGGADTMIGGAGNEIYYIDNAGDVVTETGGLSDIDLVRSTLAINLTAIANVENATVTSSANVAITGSGVANVLTGGNGANTINGGGGSDTIRGNFGADTMDGGAAVDTFLWLGLNESNGASQDTVQGFVSGTDKLDFIAIDANTDTDGNQNFVLDTNGSFSAGEFRLTDLGANLLLEGNSDNDANAEISVLFTGIGALAAGDFV